MCDHLTGIPPSPLSTIPPITPSPCFPSLFLSLLVVVPGCKGDISASKFEVDDVYCGECG